MKLKVRLADRVFQVEVGDLGERPIVATVDGERFEVWPEEQTVSGPLPNPGPAPEAGPPPEPPLPVQRPRSAQFAFEGRRASAVGGVYAPIPGVIDSVAVKAGDVVKAGQELCVLEAMKMKNIIRAPRGGEIAAVHVQPGQQVKHYDPLVEFAG